MNSQTTNFFRLLLSTIFCMNLLSCETERTVPFDADELTRQMEQITEEFEIMGLAVKLITGGEVVYEGYFGQAVYETGAELGSESVFRIASITKTVTAISLMQLWEQGFVDIDEDVSDYLGWELRNPNHPDEKITLRMLLSHTSSVRDGEGYPAFARDMIENRLLIRELFEPGASYYGADMFADHAPGHYFSYSNSTWSLVASVVERISGERFDHYTKREIFEPLGIKASFNPAAFHKEEYAALYRKPDGEWVAQVDLYTETEPKERAWEGYEPGTNGLLYGPQGSLRISAAGLTRLAQTLINGGELDGVRVLEEATLAEMTRIHWEYDGTNGNTWENFFMGYGLGIHLLTNREGKDVIFPDRKMFGHAGIAYGLLSNMYVDPDSGAGVIYIMSGSARPFDGAEDSSFYHMEVSVFDLLHPILLDLEREATQIVE